MIEKASLSTPGLSETSSSESLEGNIDILRFKV
jgi:hypothetical protein